jgi:hypothetical protein
MLPPAYHVVLIKDFDKNLFYECCCS